MRVNADALLDAVVYLEKVDAGKSLPGGLRDGHESTRRDASFFPYLSTMANGGHLEATNSDPVTHNIHTYELIGKARRGVVNVSQSEQGNTISKKIKLRKGRRHEGGMRRA